MQNSIQWYAVHTRSHFEQQAAAELARKGVECFLPTLAEEHQWKDRQKVIDVPVFSSYLFVRISDAGHDRLQVLKTNGVVRILGFGPSIEPIPAREIESLRRLVQSGKPFARHASLCEGEWALVRRGALKGIEGRLLKVKNQDRLVLSVEMLSRAVTVEVDRRDLEALPTAYRAVA